jgi:hypothetical protein
MSAGVIGGVTPLNNAEVMLLNSKSTSIKVPTISSTASASSLGDRSLFPYKAQTNAVDSFEGMVWQSLICDFFKYEKFVIIASNDYFGQKASLELTDSSYCALQAMQVFYLNSAGLGLAQQLKAMKDLGARVFVLQVSPGYAIEVALLLEQGAAMGLFEEGTQILGTSQSFDGVLQSFSAGADVKALLKGVLVLQYEPMDMVTSTISGRAFIDRWRKQAATEWKNSAGKPECNQARDDDGYTYLYRNDGEADRFNFTCAGLNYTSFAADASDIAPYLGHSYDATLVLLVGIANTIAKVGADFTGDDLMDSILYNVTFDGATGPVHVYEGTCVRV